MSNRKTEDKRNKSNKLLKDIFLNELSNLDSNIGRYDTHSLIIKGWAISLWSGLVFFTIQYSVYFLFLIQIIILLIFWSFDALYKFYQRRFSIRAEKILNFFQDYMIKDKNNELIIEKIDDSLKEKILPLVIHREESPMKVSNDREKQLKSLKRCFILRVISVFYLYLITASFFTASFIIPSKFLNIRLIISIFCIKIFGGTIVNHIWGYDNAIMGYFKNNEKRWIKWIFGIIRCIILINIIINFALLTFIIFNTTNP